VVRCYRAEEWDGKFGEQDREPRVRGQGVGMDFPGVGCAQGRESETLS